MGGFAMARIHRTARRLCVSLSLVVALLAVPGAAYADAPTRFSEHFVFFECGLPGDVFVTAFLSSEFGSGASVGTPDFSGETPDVTVSEAGGGATMDAVIPLTDFDGNSAGEAVLHAVLTPTGEETVLEPFREGNRWIKETGVIRQMAISGSLDLPGESIDLSTGHCFGEIGDVEVFATEPHAFVIGNSGVFIDCSWETPDAFASLFVASDEGGTFADAVLEVPGEHLLFTTGEADVAMNAESLEVSIPMFDEITGLGESAAASAALEPLGDPVTFFVVAQNQHEKNIQQRLIPDGELIFSTGQSFALDADSCFAATFDFHTVFTAPSGPKPGGPTPVNDTPEGALELEIGRSINQQTGGTAVAPELPATTCPEFFDAFGHTVWYTFTGTGDPLTVETAGSNFDTMLAVYDAELTEIACEDDVGLDPVGFSLQAALTIDTIEGATYYVQVGGFDPVIFTGVSTPQFGRLRISLSD